MKKTVFLVLLFLLLFPYQAFAYRIGIITDIHAGRDRIRNYHKYTPHNILYPRWYKTYLKRVLTDFKVQGVETIILNGDVTNGDSLKYAQAVKKIVNSAGIENFWVKGNHEGKKIKKVYFAGGTYYFVDRGGWRLIILDSNYASPNGSGWVNEAQIAWLRSTIADTSGPVAVFMHHPLFMLRNGQPDGMYASYSDLEKAFSESGKVKYVISGHVHTPDQYTRTLNDVQYITNTPLTFKGHLGSYQVIDLPE